jgi:competence protein ComFA
MLFYILCSKTGEFYISPTMEWDKHPDGMEVLLPGIPLGFAQMLLRDARRFGRQREKKSILKEVSQVQGLPAQNWRWEKVRSSSEKPQLTSKEMEFIRRSQGRQLSEGDLQRLCSESDLTLSEGIEYCQRQVQQGEAEWLPAVCRVGVGWRCMRCGEERVEEWSSIYGIAATCPSCASLGALSSLQVLYRCSFLENIVIQQGNDDISFSPRWELSQAQKKASEDVLEFVSDKTHKNDGSILLWAACGAGKTEVCFPAASWALNQGQRILFAAPRQDVVVDVAPRLLQDFPGIELSVLTGDSTERFAPAKFVLATTHQVLRFYKAFDLIFLDEMDAFPYHGNSILAWGLHQALKKTGKIIYLTATPSPESIENVNKGRMHVVHLPARHHRRALPVPEWVKSTLDIDRENLSGVRTDKLLLSRWVKELAKAGPVLCFVPKISWVNPVVDSMREVFPQWEIAGSHSSDPQRREKIEGLRNKRYQVFVSTSILERGVTVPSVQVIVLAADHDIFNERALVQMAGRVGRTREDPSGRAIFLAKKRTRVIEKAICWIEEQNALAFKHRLID